MFDYNEKFNYFEDDDLAKDWYNRMCGNIAWKAFQKQNDWIFMQGELGKDAEGRFRKPMIKDNALEVFSDYVDEQLAWMKESMIMGFMKIYQEDDIDLPDDIAWELKEYFGEE